MDRAVEQHWIEACADAEFRPNVDVFLFVGDESAGGGHRARFFAAGVPVDDLSALEPRAAAEAKARNGSHRVILFDRRNPLLGPLLRHELEHAIHADAIGGTSLHRQENLAAAAPERFAEGAAKDGRGGTFLYQMLPSERDANVAAAPYSARGRVPRNADDCGGRRGNARFVRRVALNGRTPGAWVRGGSDDRRLGRATSLRVALERVSCRLGPTPRPLRR